MESIVCWGDSLTAGGGLAEALGESTSGRAFNAGVGGEGSLMIMARANAMPALVHAEGGAIPAQGPVEVSLTTSYWAATPLHPLLQGNGTDQPGEPASQLARGTVGGVPGSLSFLTRDPEAQGSLLPAPGDRYCFTRDEPGAEVSLPVAAPFRFAFGEQHRADTHVVWMGQNDSDAHTVLAMFEAFARWAHGPFVFLTGTGDTDPGWTWLERRMQDRWGLAYVNVRRFLKLEAPAILGLELDSADRLDVRLGRLPGQLRTDHVHLTHKAQRVAATHLVYPRLLELTG